MLLPRRVMRRLRFVSFFYRATWRAWSRLASLLPRNGHREHFLGFYGALSMVVSLVGIPTTLHDSLMARLDRLASVRLVAQIGAAIGHGAVLAR